MKKRYYKLQQFSCVKSAITFYLIIVPGACLPCSFSFIYTRADNSGFRYNYDEYQDAGLGIDSKIFRAHTFSESSFRGNGAKMLGVKFDMKSKGDLIKEMENHIFEMLNPKSFAKIQNSRPLPEGPICEFRIEYFRDGISWVVTSRSADLETQPKAFKKMLRFVFEELIPAESDPGLSPDLRSWIHPDNQRKIGNEEGKDSEMKSAPSTGLSVPPPQPSPAPPGASSTPSSPSTTPTPTTTREYGSVRAYEH